MRSGHFANTARTIEKTAWPGIAAAIVTVTACGGNGGSGGSGGTGGATTSSTTSTTSTSTSTTSTGGGAAHLADWGRKFLGTEQTASSVAVDAQGNIYVGGSVSAGMVDFGAGQFECPTQPGGPSWCGFLLKLDPMGNTVWSKVSNADDALPLDVTGLGVTAGGNLVIAAYWQRRQLQHAPLDLGAGPLDPAGDNPMVLARFDSTGKALWSAAYGDDSGYVIPASLVTDGSDSFTVGGVFSTAALDFGGGAMPFVSTDTLFLAHFDGTTLGWQKSFAGMTGQELGGFGRGPGGEILLAGTFEDSLDFGGPALSGTGVFQAKLDASGGFGASRSFDVTGVSTSVTGVAADAAGSTLVTGLFDDTLKLGATTLTCQGDLNGYIAKIDANGQVVFAHATTDPMMSDDGSPSVAADASNNVIWGDNVIFSDHREGTITKLDPSGATLWTVAGQNFGPRAFAVDASGNVIAVGEFTTEIDFVKGGPITATMGLNAFVAKFSP